jgi:FKBP-type peptidyl-prolyl cis-trans isomerase FkpA
MKNILLGLIILSAVCISCSKKDVACNLNDSNITASASETANVQAYLTANSITATPHPSGFYYKITQTGTGQAIANLCSNVTIKYTGKLTNGTVFDQTAVGATATFTLGQLIVGWQKGLPLISSGGKITLYIPPSLGYGSAAAGSIPANSILIFDIELISVS